MKKMLIMLICLLCISGCSKTETNEDANSTVDTTETIEDENYQEIELKQMNDVFVDDASFKEANKQYGIFATNLFKKTFKENENALISPYSLYAVLSILANGAVDSDKAQTRSLLENVLGLTVNDLNKFYSYTNKNLDVFNTLLFNSDFNVSIDEKLKKTINEYYGDSLKEASFKNADEIVKEANSWSSEKTNGAIPSIVENSDIKDDTIMLLLNALSVDGFWDLEFDTDKTVLQQFANSDSNNVNVSMMKQTLSGYWKTDNAQGFTKYVATDAKTYTFVGILPNEDVDIKTFVENLDENTIGDMIGSYVYYDNIDEENMIADVHYTNLSFPKFDYSINNELVETLKKLGLSPLFDYNTCDFSLFGSDNIYLQTAKQKTNVEVNEEKVKMAAVTVVGGGMGSTGYNVREEIYHDVTFDRPFVYALVETTYVNGKNENVILFTGVVNKLENETEVKTLKESIGSLSVEADLIKIRSTPTIKEDNQVGKAKKYDYFEVYEVKQTEGYTWYRVDENAWIADDGTWVRYFARS